MEENKKQHSALTIDRAAFLLLRVKKAFKKKKLQRKEREKNALLAASNRIDQRASCAGLESGAAGRTGKKPPPLLRSRTLPAIIVPGVSILQAQLGNCTPQQLPEWQSKDSQRLLLPTRLLSFSRDDSTMSPDVRRRSAVSRLCSAANYGHERSADGTLVLRVPAPHVVAGRAYRIQSSSPTPLNRLGKLLNQGITSSTSSKNQMMTIDDVNVTRRLSWERRETAFSHLPRSSSIDSMVDAVWSETAESQQEPSTISPVRTSGKRPSLRTDRSLALVSPSVGRRMKGQRGINELPTLPVLEVPVSGGMEVASLPSSTALPPPGSSAGHKPSKKEAKLMQQRLERLAKVNIHLHALFAAVEHGHLDKARTILESTDVDVNSLNSDRLSPLDVAVLSNNRPMVKMLQSFGGREGGTGENLGYHLKKLLEEAEMRLHDLGGGGSGSGGGFFDEDDTSIPLNTRASFSSIIGSSNSGSMAMSGCAGGDIDKQAMAWCKRAKMLKRLVLGFTQARPPDPPTLMVLDITSQTRVSIRLQLSNNDSPIITKFMVQWSTKSDFSLISGEKEVLDVADTSCSVDLTPGRRYYFRSACGNVKGYGNFLQSTPPSVIPSSWTEIDRKKSRYDGRLKQLDRLMDEVKKLRPGSDILEVQGPSQRRTQRKKTTIKQLFTAASKFQKNLRRGIYLACILYHEDKVLVTNEDFLPVIEIDETFPSCIHSDLHWLMKVSCTWDDAKSLKIDMDKNMSSLSSIHFRTKLLSAVLQMQSSLCLQDLGQLYHKPLKDSQGTMVLSTVNYVKSPKSVSVLNSRWLPMNKVNKKIVLGDDHNISDVLMASIQEQINYHQVSSSKLSKGLYLAYLKMQSSVDLIQVVVPANSPNMLPHCKVRDNPHVSAEEWEYLKQQHLPDLTDNATEQQRTFLELITSAAKRLFNYMGISTDDASTHRLYDSEVIDLIDSNVSFIVICPSAELSCSVPGQREILLQRGDLLSLPLQVFEMIHLNTYQNEIIKKYSKLSCLLELDAAAANHLHREAFSNSEVAVAKERLAKLQDLQTKLNTIWKFVRWLMDLVTFARDRLMFGISLRLILDKDGGGGGGSPSGRNLLQIPTSSKIVKSTPGRGSWPGPGAGQLVSPMNLINEFSKSEQHLSMNMTNETSIRNLSATCSDSGSRKNSDSYNSSDFFSEPVNRLPPSRSDDALFALPTTSASCHRVRACTISSVSASATTSPLLNIRRPLYSSSLASVNTATSDSLHSLSSDSDGPAPLSASTPQKMMPSRSMTNVVKLNNKSSETSIMARPKNLDLLETSNLSKSLSNVTNKDHPSNQSGILQVYAAYETGLASGTSLKLHVTPRTTAREVVDLVVKQLNMAVVLKGKEGPIYSSDKLKNFCLVAVIGARERCLRDDFKPLQLQNPWKKGRLYVRQKHDVLAALEHSSKHSAII